MSTPIITHNLPSPSPPPQPGRITTTPTLLPTWPTTRPILRFDFPTPETQAVFHRAFAQIKNEKDVAGFMARFFENYDGVVVVVPLKSKMDTGRDEELARRLQEELDISGGYEVRSAAAGDEAVARRVQGEWGVEMDVRGDEELARCMQEELDGSGRSAVVDDEVVARRVQGDDEPRDDTSIGVGRGGFRSCFPPQLAYGVLRQPFYGGRGFRVPRPRYYGGGRCENAGYLGYGAGDHTRYGGAYGYGLPRRRHEVFYDDEEGDEYEDGGYANEYGFESRNRGYGPGYGGGDYYG